MCGCVCVFTCFDEIQVYFHIQVRNIAAKLVSHCLFIAAPLCALFPVCVAVSLNRLRVAALYLHAFGTALCGTASHLPHTNHYYVLCMELIKIQTQDVVDPLSLNVITFSSYSNNIYHIRKNVMNSSCIKVIFTVMKPIPYIIGRNMNVEQNQN